MFPLVTRVRVGVFVPHLPVVLGAVWLGDVTSVVCVACLASIGGTSGAPVRVVMFALIIRPGGYLAFCVARLTPWTKGPYFYVRLPVVYR